MGKPICTRRLRKSNVTAFRSIFKNPTDIKFLSKLTCHSQKTMDNHYDFSDHMEEVLQAHSLLQESRSTTDPGLMNVEIEAEIRTAVKNEGCNVNLEALHQKLNGLWTREMIQVKIDYYLRTLRSAE